MPNVGDSAPTFTLKNDIGEEIALPALAGRRVVLYFYPKDDTPGCTTQACALRDGWADVEALGVLQEPELEGDNSDMRLALWLED